jgi:hypothetical protein
MRKVPFVFLCSIPLLIAFFMLACGSSSQLQSVSISPATADAKDYANGQVQFTATGTQKDGSQVKPLTALWTPAPPWSLTPQQPWPAITLDSTGLASCGSANPGTYTIVATAPVDPHFPLSQMTMSTPQVGGAATLTCP